jgi:hypothetical protein
VQSLGECRLCELWDQWKDYRFRKLSPPKERPTVNSMSAELWYSTTTPKRLERRDGLASGNETHQRAILPLSSNDLPRRWEGEDEE